MDSGGAARPGARRERRTGCGDLRPARRRRGHPARLRHLPLRQPRLLPGTSDRLPLLLRHRRRRRPGWPWNGGEALISGVYDEVLDVVRQWRPVSVFPDILAANQVDVGIRATLVVEAGHDEEAVKGAILDAVRASVNRLRLGHGVLHSDIVLSARTAAASWTCRTCGCAGSPPPSARPTTAVAPTAGPRTVRRREPEPRPRRDRPLLRGHFHGRLQVVVT
ncbi:hypothetical protein LV779_25670 [Streptomyces thinghirensis]|nr:hypothetical protein [Streptomyces thinghirensis]